MPRIPAPKTIKSKRNWFSTDPQWDDLDVPPTHPLFYLRDANPADLMPCPTREHMVELLKALDEFITAVKDRLPVMGEAAPIGSDADVWHAWKQAQHAAKCVRQLRRLHAAESGIGRGYLYAGWPFQLATDMTTLDVTIEQIAEHWQFPKPVPIEIAPLPAKLWSDLQRLRDWLKADVEAPASTDPPMATQADVKPDDGGDYTYAAMQELTGTHSTATLNKYARLASVSTPGRGKGAAFTKSEAQRILSMFINNTRSPDTRRRCQHSLKEIEIKSK